MFGSDGGGVRTGLGEEEECGRRQAPGTSLSLRQPLTQPANWGSEREDLSKESMEVGRSKTMCSKKAVTRLQERGQLAGCQRSKRMGKSEVRMGGVTG